MRDVADLHLRAMTDPAAVGERFFATSGRSLRIIEVARILPGDVFNANALDPATRPPAARGGYDQGRALAEQLAEFWQ